MSAEANDDAILEEKAVLDCIIAQPELIARVEFDLAGDFLDPDCRALYRAANKLHAEGVVVDIPLLVSTSGVDFAIVSDIATMGSIAIPGNFDKHVASVRDAARERRTQRSIEELQTASPEDRPRILERIQDLSQPAGTGIRTFEAIPDIQTMDIPAVDLPSAGSGHCTEYDHALDGGRW